MYSTTPLPTFFKEGNHNHKMESRNYELIQRQFIQWDLRLIDKSIQWHVRLTDCLI